LFTVNDAIRLYARICRNGSVEKDRWRRILEQDRFDKVLPKCEIPYALALVGWIHVQKTAIVKVPEPRDRLLIDMSGHLGCSVHFSVKIAKTACGSYVIGLALA
jgi:hypothetical protein